MIVIVFISIIIYLIATLIISSTLKSFTRGEKIKLIIVGFLIVLFITFIICSATSAGINIGEKELVKVTKNTAILVFSPVNSIILLPVIGRTLNKYRDEDITDENLRRRIILTIILLVVVILIENNYIKNFQTGLLNSVIK